MAKVKTIRTLESLVPVRKNSIPTSPKLSGPVKLYAAQSGDTKAPRHQPRDRKLQAKLVPKRLLTIARRFNAGKSPRKEWRTGGTLNPSTASLSLPEAIPYILFRTGPARQTS